jgi:hypothetical protein
MIHLAALLLTVLTGLTGLVYEVSGEVGSSYKAEYFLSLKGRGRAYQASRRAIDCGRHRWRGAASSAPPPRNPASRPEPEGR